ncbi:hypothetical protein BGX34_011625 [Mortierella sp. NVP85]|nr:hypothetical protein BGX34_011625 [Mortierella sp. NVP85]
MFNIPELHGIVCRHLDHHDLTQCARVNKKWHAAAIPYLWRDLSCLEDSHNAQRQSFGKLVLENYLHEQRHHQPLNENHNAVHSQQTQTSLPLPTLAKYSPWIRLLPGPGCLLKLLGFVQSQQRQTAPDKCPTEHELLLHLYQHCHAAQISRACLYFGKDRSDDPEQEITELVLPRVIRPHCRIWYPLDISEYPKLMYDLDRCSTTLEELTIALYVNRRRGFIPHLHYRDPAEQLQEVTAPREWTSLKKLTLCLWGFRGDLKPKVFWSWLFKRCRRVERLIINSMDLSYHEYLAVAMSTQMLNLNELVLMWVCPSQAPGLLSASRRGWKAVEFMNNIRISGATQDALKKHFSTLEVLHVSDSGSQAIETPYMVEVLSACPNLRVLIDHAIGNYFDEDWRRFRAQVFADQDPETGLLRTWACESSLKVLKIKIVVDLDEGGREEVFAVQRGAQGLVYDRLARLTNLEILWLGNWPYGADSPTNHQRDCLEMSLESGLHKLASLRKLEELSVSGTRTRIGVEEVQWMTEHWPRLRVIYGLEDGHNKDAVGWLREHHPGIRMLNLSRPVQQ